MGRNAPTWTLSKSGVVPSEQVMQPASENRFDSNFAAQLLVEIAHEKSLEKLLERLIEGVMERPYIVCGQIWLIEKGDLCATCSFRAECSDQ